jgi:CheY-like chemotaxis protein
LPDAIILDERMDGTTGLAIARRIRKNRLWSGLYVIVASADETSLPKAIAAGANEFWVKGTERMLKSAEQLAETLQKRRP